MLAPGVATAAGFWNLDWGAANYGRGGADTAAPQDPSAMMRNPAALAGHKGLSFLVDTNLTFDARSYTRSPDALAPSYEEVKNDQGQNFSPSSFVAYNFGALLPLPVAIGAGAWGPAPRTDVVFPEDGPQRYSLIESRNLQIHYGFATAAELPWLGLKVGVTAMLISQLIEQSLMLNAVPADNASDPSLDARVDVEARDDYIPSAIFAVSATPIEWVTVALSYQLGWKADAEGTADVTLVGSLLQDYDVEGDDVRVQLELPAVARFAAQLHDPEGLFDVELALVWEQWSANETIVFQPQDIALVTPTGTQELDDVVIESGFRDTVSARLGGELRVVPDLLRVRAGGFWERGAVPSTRMAPASFDLDKFGFAAGARLDGPFGTWADLAFGMSLWARQNIDDSDVRISDPVSGESYYSIGNGSYTNRQIFVMAAIGATFDI